MEDKTQEMKANSHQHINSNFINSFNFKNFTAPPTPSDWQLIPDRKRQKRTWESESDWQPSSVWIKYRFSKSSERERVFKPAESEKRCRKVRSHYRLKKHAFCRAGTVLWVFIILFKLKSCNFFNPLNGVTVLLLVKCHCKSRFLGPQMLKGR